MDVALSADYAWAILPYLITQCARAHDVLI